MTNIDFKKGNGLVPAIIQDNNTLQVLMAGYMNEEAYNKTVSEGRVTFYSRSKKRLWTKGETSGNYLIVNNITTDCDNDALLIKVSPAGPVCHTGSKSCFGPELSKGFIYQLENIISRRIDDNAEASYTNQLYRKGINKVAQKVGEEAIELVIEAKDDNTELFKNEAADLLYHFLILLKTRNVAFEDIEEVLRERHAARG
ncbi:MAG TPA: bifunctional phosphoribosyl-AMP cyclohydrolase/phosphoribosyl-ATP diphosphatase HisIE [Bacteroidales bacterium]|jgi:phosphoribosyl-ATP pyrophosphohydrolase/phosphoribosyl-AMP cyclohydrolase|nr:bifunctional phosphoribosyl-AMP cyclohydrolase/phosphoribosyl-ATP diphosphatase HisIE [Bacteroidales bacterium]HNY53835.1 bifunctional phosphoribosyl-AMP cyclohydrolase/phosphoribosyl-ATP diphosphatase HisIE [Bacteroidales bacterium]HOG57381.1 bifunctional phosphoribosyl-AMP cyclohydrolase/phosphoribosyl-ATP diphosphatase HisIE [Bacteroidales bacterium]HPB13401.1 bifunctional phosphoribosyl-AMP cyclohydrolase/phosphoribosyl-ATP diphosphatase HisIE [Bacteroidales bacterium]HPV16704.1 bifuncti